MKGLSEIGIQPLNYNFSREHGDKPGSFHTSGSGTCYSTRQTFPNRMACMLLGVAFANQAHMGRFHIC